MDCGSAIIIPPGCADGVYSNVGLPDNPVATDPLHTIYGISPISSWHHQMWFQMTNDTLSPKYVRFTITAAFGWSAGLYLECPPTSETLYGIAPDPTTGVQRYFIGNSLGTIVDPGQTVWLEIADEVAFAANFTLAWEFRESTTSEASDPTVAPVIATVPLHSSAPRHVRFQGDSWLVQSLGTVGQPVATNPAGDPQDGFVVSRVDDLGSVTTYNVPVPIFWGWNGFQSSFRIDLCHYDIFLARTGWNAGWASGGDYRFATDGTNLWLGILVQWTQRYPWYRQQIPTPGGDLTGYVSDIPTLEAVAAAGNYIGNYGSFLCHDAPYDDLGGAFSQRFEPWGLVMYVWNGAGFTQIGEIPGHFANEVGATADDYTRAMISGLEMCASEAEPGVCHAVWSELGPWGTRDPGPGPWPNRGSALRYSKWDTGGNVADVDLLYAEIFDTTVYPPNGSEAYVNVSPIYSPFPDPFGPSMTDDTLCFTNLFTVKNDHGWPILFVTRLVQIPPPPGDEDFVEWGITGEPTVRMWDLRSPVTNAPVELQQITPDLYPDADETQYSFCGVFTVDQISPNLSFGGSGVQPRDFILGFAPLYEDPLLAGEAVYLVWVNWTCGANGVYRVPCDGSGPFDFLDGDRDVAIFPNVRHQFNFGPGPANYPIPGDFFSEPKAVWAPGEDGPDSLWQLDRECLHDWRHISLAPGSATEIQPTSPSSPPIYDPATRKFYYAAGVVVGGFFTVYAACQTGICDCDPCVLGPCVEHGIHIWHLPPHHR